jgi:hypothetical protein
MRNLCVCATLDSLVREGMPVSVVLNEIHTKIGNFSNKNLQQAW